MGRNMKRMGFTLLEVMVVLVIVGILSALSVTTYGKFKANGDLRQASMNLYMEFSNLHQTALQYDAMVFVKFFATQCSVYVDTNNNGTADAGDLKKAIRFPSSVFLGVATSGPTGTPPDLNTLSGMTGNWNTQMTVKNDPVGTINNGAVYLHSKYLDRITYCIGLATPMLTFKQYKWGGSLWVGL
jgi:prepilin-type N-terminal cleavage/methylation domain-containing protein